MFSYMFIGMRMCVLVCANIWNFQLILNIQLYVPEHIRVLQYPCLVETSSNLLLNSISPKRRSHYLSRSLHTPAELILVDKSNTASGIKWIMAEYFSLLLTTARHRSKSSIQYSSFNCCLFT